LDWPVVLCTVLSAGLDYSACQGDLFEDSYADYRARNPAGLSVTLRTEKDAFFMGERIRITLDFQNTSDTRYHLSTRSYDRGGRIDEIQFHVDGPTNGFADPLTLYFAATPTIRGGLGGLRSLGQFSRSFDLNEWVRFDRPGSYRLYCTNTLVETGDWTGTSVPLCSQIVDLSVTEPNDAWITEQVRRALEEATSADPKERWEAVRVLRFLAAPQAMAPLASLLGQADLRLQAFLGLVGAPDPSQARQALLEGIGDPTRVVNDTYLRALALVSAAPDEPVLPFDPADPDAYRRQYERLKAEEESALQEAVEALSAALPLKRGRARAAACLALLQREADNPGLREKLANAFTDLTEAEQIRVLGYDWEQVRCPAFAVPLEQILSRPATYERWSGPQLRSWAARRYLDIRPTKARSLILEDMRRARPMLAGAALLHLPDKLLPQLDDVFAAHLADPSGDRSKLPHLIERYASKRILPDVTEYYRQREGTWACEMQERLLGYWIKHDPEAGLRAVRRAAILREHTGCFRTVLEYVLSRYYSPAAERLAISFLTDNDVVVHVVRLLDRKGSSVIVDPLLARLAAANSGDEVTPGQGTFPKASVRTEILSCLFKKRDWQLTGAQKRRLYDLLESDAERDRFKRRFPELLPEQAPISPRQRAP
jgi:hypothetical protein